MMITRLCEFARRENLIDEPAFERKPVAWVLVVDDEGRPVELTRTQGEQVATSRGRERTLAKEMLVPKVGNRTDGKTPCFAADTLTRVIPGWAERQAAEAKEPPKVADLNTRSSFVDLLREAAEATRQPSLTAVVKFYDRAAGDAGMLQPLHQTLLDGKAKPAEWVTFRRFADVDQNILEFDEVKGFWRARAQASRASRQGDSEQMRCLSCGRIAPIADTHGKLKGVPGGNPAGVSLVSSDKAAFSSYLLKKSQTGPTCVDCVEAYTRALNELLSRSNTRYKEGVVAFCFWTRQPSEDDWTILTAPRPEQVKRLLHSPRSPAPGDVDSNEFYAVSLSGVGGRAMVREWIEETVPRVRENIRRWFADLAIVLDRHAKDDEGNIWVEAGETFETWRLRQLIAAIGRRSDRGIDVAPQLPAVLFEAAIRGLPLPRSVLAAAVRRIQAERDVPPARAAILRLALNRELSLTSDSPQFKGDRTMPEGLDLNRMDAAYLCGRLLAVLARLQYLALGSTNATIVSRCYGAASTAPVTVFGRLMDLAQSHLKKLSSSIAGAAVNVEKDIEEILAKVGDWPRQLPLQDQALFALGYYHQRAEYRRRRKDEGGSEGEEPIPAATEETEAA